MSDIKIDKTICSKPYGDFPCALFIIFRDFNSLCFSYLFIHFVCLYYLYILNNAIYKHY